MKRREFVERVSMGSAALVAGGVLKPNSPPVKAAKKEQHEHGGVDGPLSSATVSFGGWNTDPPLDRFTVPNDRTRNHHALTPLVSTIKQGGTVNFIIGGFHHILIYAPGTKMTDINTGLIVPGSAPPLIDDPANRVYRGLDPRTLTTQDRVETVVLSNPGKYLVVCGVLPHFQDNMHGFINVLPAKDDDK
jgi:plastocyanin